MGLIECSYRNCCSFGPAWCEVGEVQRRVQRRVGRVQRRNWGLRRQIRGGGGEIAGREGCSVPLPLSQWQVNSGWQFKCQTRSIYFTRENKPSPQIPGDRGENRKYLALRWAAIEEHAELPESWKTTFNSGATSRRVPARTWGSRWSHPWVTMNNYKQEHMRW